MARPRTDGHGDCDSNCKCCLTSDSSPSLSGKGNSTTTSNLLHTAGSRSWEWLVAASSRPLGGHSSTSCSSTATKRLSSPVSLVSSRRLAIASSSSMSKMQPLSRAWSKTARKLLPVRPRKELITAERFRMARGCPSSRAIHLADSVLPTPGGPVKSTDLVGLTPKPAKRSPARRSRKTCFSVSAVEESYTGSNSRTGASIIRMRGRRESPSTGKPAGSEPRRGLPRTGVSRSRRTRRSARLGSLER